MHGPDASAAPGAVPYPGAGISREEAIRRGLHAVARLGFGRYAHGPAENVRTAGEFITYVLPDAAQTVCDELRREDLHRPGPHGPPAVPRHDLRGSDGRFRCGHARVPDNTYEYESSARCRKCAIKQSLAWRQTHLERRRKYDKAYRAQRAANGPASAQDRLALAIYFHLRRLMLADGAWPLRGERAAEERSVA